MLTGFFILFVLMQIGLAVRPPRLMDQRLADPGYEAVDLLELRGFRVAVREGQGVTAVSIDLSGHLPPGVELRPRRGGYDELCGDPELDHLAVIRGDPALIAAALSFPARRMFVRAIEDCAAELAAGLLRGKCRLVADRATMVEPMVRLAEALSFPLGSLEQRLLQRLRDEPEAGVRRRLYAALAGRFRGSEADLRAIELGLCDPDAELRFLSARRAGMEGVPVLMALAAERTLEPALHAEVLRLLGRRTRGPQLLALAVSALSSDDLTVVGAATEILARARHSAAVPALVTLLWREEVERVEVAAQALGAIRDPAAQPALFELLQHPDWRMRVPAVMALGELGTTDAVGRLREVRGPLVLRSEIETAIAKIKDRATGSGHGQLSLVKREDHGQLSLAPDRGGLSTGEP